MTRATKSLRNTILVITAKLEYHADLVTDALRKRGIPVIRFEPEDFPQEAAIACRFSDEAQTQLISCQGQDFDLEQVRTVWLKHPGAARVLRDLSEADRELALSESTHILGGLWMLLPDRFWVNRPEASRRGNLKPLQLGIARELGFRVPRTLMTNRPEDVAAFFDECEGQLVYKGFTAHMRVVDGRTYLAFTNRLTARHLEQRENIRVAPGIFQEYVPKKVELRITVIGKRVFAAEIHSQNSERSRDDWRRYDFPNTPYYPHTLPPEIEHKCLQLLARLDLAFGCIDMILRPDGEYVFLEINPDGQWYWIEQRTGLPLLDHFLEMLIQGTTDYAAPTTQSLAAGTTP